MTIPVIFFKSDGIWVVFMTINIIKINGKYVDFVDNKDFNLLVDYFIRLKILKSSGLKNQNSYFSIFLFCDFLYVFLLNMYIKDSKSVKK